MPVPFRYRSRIRFVDTDASQRIHYTAMFRHFEAAEQDFFHSIGCPLTAPEFRDLGFPRVHVDCDFFAEIRFDDFIEVAPTVERVGTSSFTLQFAATIDGRPVSKGRVTIVCLDKHTQRSCAIPPRLAQALRDHLAKDPVD